MARALHAEQHEAAGGAHYDVGDPEAGQGVWRPGRDGLPSVEDSRTEVETAADYEQVDGIQSADQGAKEIVRHRDQRVRSARTVQKGIQSVLKSR